MSKVCVMIDGLYGARRARKRNVKGLSLSASRLIVTTAAAIAIG